MSAVGRVVTRTPRGIFVTGTDTGVGKTIVTAALLRGLAAEGLRAVGMKPVASGIEPPAAVNADVAALVAAGNVDALLADVNPYAFVPAIAPHIAAGRAGVRIDLGTIAAAYSRLASRADAVVVEGAGGAFSPISEVDDMLDIATRLGVPVLLVVGIRLGCLNHALLSAQAIRARGLRLAGWVANRLDPEMPAAAENIATLDRRLAAPRVADLAFLSSPPVAAPIGRAALTTLELLD